LQILLCIFVAAKRSFAFAELCSAATNPALLANLLSLIIYIAYMPSSKRAGLTAGRRPLQFYGITDKRDILWINVRNHITK
jgi:hypothetical protein